MSLRPYTGVAGIFFSPHWLSGYPSTKLETPVDSKTFKHLSTLPSAVIHFLHPSTTICVLVIFHPRRKKCYEHRIQMLGKFISQTPAECNSFKRLWIFLLTHTPSARITKAYPSPEHLWAINLHSSVWCYYSTLGPTIWGKNFPLTITLHVRIGEISRSNQPTVCLPAPLPPLRAHSWL